MIEEVLLWVGETALGALIKGWLGRFFPSTEERLGEAEQEVRDDNATIDTIREKQETDQAVDSMPDRDAVIELSKWRRK